MKDNVHRVLSDLWSFNMHRVASINPLTPTVAAWVNLQLYWLIVHGLTFHQHSIGCTGDGFTGQKTQPTVSKYWRNTTSYKAACARPDYAVIFNFWHLGTPTLRAKRTVVLIWQPWASMSYHTGWLIKTSPTFSLKGRIWSAFEELLR